LRGGNRAAHVADVSAIARLVAVLVDLSQHLEKVISQMLFNRNKSQFGIVRESGEI
jgi:hypothetical protein